MNALISDDKLRQEIHSVPIQTLMDCFINYPAIDQGFILDFPTIRKYQEESNSMKKK